MMQPAILFRHRMSEKHKIQSTIIAARMAKREHLCYNLHRGIANNGRRLFPWCHTFRISSWVPTREFVQRGWCSMLAFSDLIQFGLFVVALITLIVGLMRDKKDDRPCYQNDRSSLISHQGQPSIGSASFMS